ncbi:MAG: hypothetical protein KGR19_10785 [Acidobacteria bacterium]|nr:hypothetical protein [Acidobacteriota bacterium]
MKSRFQRHAGTAALAIALVALVASLTGAADAARKAMAPSAKPRPYGLLTLGKNKKFPASAIPTVAQAKRLGSLKQADVEMNCDAITVDLGTWCLMTNPYPVPPEDQGKNNYLYATQKCIEEGGYLPTAAQLVGAAARVKLASTIDDDQLTASIDLDATDGLRDRREMSATLVTTQAGSSAAGSIGISDGSKGDPRTGEPDPPTLPAVPLPETLQYVTVYDNRDKGGFAGSRPVSQAENFRCAFNKNQGPPRGGESGGGNTPGEGDTPAGGNAPTSSGRAKGSR